MVTPKCYNVTVNESETITEAQRFCLVPSRDESGGFPAFGRRGCGRAHVERS
jgi:hypothetical protein